jgi:hypothetical protein
MSPWALTLVSSVRGRDPTDADLIARDPTRGRGGDGRRRCRQVMVIMVLTRTRAGPWPREYQIIGSGLRIGFEHVRRISLAEPRTELLFRTEPWQH